MPSTSCHGLYSCIYTCRIDGESFIRNEEWSREILYCFCQFPRLNERELAAFDCKHELFYLFLPWTCLCWVYWITVSLPTLHVFPCSGGFLMTQLSAARSVANELMLPRSSIMCVGVFPCCKLCSQPSQEMELALIFGFGQSFRQICLFT